MNPVSEFVAWSGALPVLCAGNALFLFQSMARRRAGALEIPRPALTCRGVCGGLLLGFLAWTACQAVRAAEADGPPDQLIAFLAGLFLAQLVSAAWPRLAPRLRTVPEPGRLLALVLLEVPSLGLLYFSGEGREYYYHSVHRLRGMFQNPNTAGLFALLNLLLLAGALLQTRTPAGPGSRTLRAALGLEWIAHLFALVASGSRGSWLGAFAALVCLGVCRRGDAFRFPGPLFFTGRGFSWWLSPADGATNPGTWRGNRFRLAGLAVVVFAVLIFFAGLAARHGVYARRLTSLLDPNDFSARNRVLALLLSARAAFESWPSGPGLEQVGPMLQSYYAPLPFAEGLPFHLNSFAMIGAGLGLPALLLIAFAVLFALGSRPIPMEDRSAAALWKAALCAICAAAVFDGGLFTLSVAWAFWMSLLSAAGTVAAPPRPAAFAGVLALFAPAFLVLYLAAPALANPEGASIERLRYRGGDGALLDGRLASPTDSPARGLVLFTHGSGNRWFDDGAMLRAFAARGFAGATFDFRARDQASYHSDFTAFRSLLQGRENLRRLPVVWCGDSWGAFETLLEAIQGGEPKPLALVCLSGPWSSVQFRVREAVERAGAGPPGPGRETAPPLPVLLVHGAEDPAFPVRSCRQIARLLPAAGLRPVMGVVPDWGHVPDANLGLIVGKVAAQIGKLGIGPVPSPGPAPGLRGIRLTSYRTFLREVEAAVWMSAGAAGIIVLGLALAARLGYDRLINANLLKRWPALAPVMIAATLTGRAGPTGAAGWTANLAGEASDYGKLTLYQWDLLAKDWCAPDQSRRALAELLKSGPAPAREAEARPAGPGEVSWRRPLWELFYPMVKSQANPLEAARAVARYLSQYPPELAVECPSARLGGGGADLRVPLVRLYAAALRALAVPARETSLGTVEIWANDGWTAAPPLKNFDFLEL